ncbi:MAG TPA: hypothetical protein VE954_08070 [Oligoflexus sp.]|uniref:hypothetical protein n=1 Tax=Oligoflexus sp. TaxID=1971216 RepID=UPI002D2A8937|nr:hypothetical protein [Oligoflexus sp.]HYX33058.1 hypothetical protein [Oligoflexus sp.]
MQTRGLVPLLFLLTACLSSPEPEVNYPLAAHEDKPYFQAYEAASVKYDVIHNFETRFKAQITRVTPAFQQALTQRYAHIWNEPQPLIQDAAAKTAFFVTIYTANQELENVADADLWNIQLQVSGQTLKPSAIKKLKPKERWQPFFPEINHWSREFLLLFDRQPDNGTEPMKLTLSSPDGSVRAEW